MTGRIAFLFFFLMFSGFGAENVRLRTEIHTIPHADPEETSVQNLLKRKDAEKVFSASLACLPESTAFFSLRNEFESRRIGFEIKSTPRTHSNRNFMRVDAAVSWQFSPEGVFRTSGFESFDEGFSIESKRILRLGDSLPAGVFATKSGGLFVPVLTLSSVEAGADGGEVSRAELILSCFPGRKEAFEKRLVFRLEKGFWTLLPPEDSPDGVRVSGSIVSRKSGLMKIKFSFRRPVGARPNGERVFETLDLESWTASPAPGKDLILAEAESFCGGENSAYETLPSKGGVPARYVLTLRLQGNP